jgi:hypothetical protein
MKGVVDFSMRGKTELTKKRHRIGILLRSARRGRKNAKDRLFREFGIRVYSPKEVEEYVREKLKTELVEESPLKISSKRIPNRRTR